MGFIKQSHCAKLTISRQAVFISITGFCILTMVITPAVVELFPGATPVSSIVSESQYVSSILFNTTNLANDSFLYTINEADMCSDDQGKPTLLVVVFVGAHEQRRRQFIRDTWGSAAKTNPKIRLIFIIGKTNFNQSTQIRISRESSRYHDIIQADYLDTYRNLTLKSFAVYKWVGMFCSSATYILKIDADMRIDLKRLLQILERYNIPDKYLCGSIYVGCRVVRDPKHKFYVSWDMYARTYFIPYCFGPAYIVSQRIVQKIASEPVPAVPFPVDDMFLTGLLRIKLNESMDDSILKINHEKKVRVASGLYVGNVEFRNPSLIGKRKPKDKGCP